MTIGDLLIADKEEVLLSNLVLNDDNSRIINNLIKEYTYIDDLKKYNLPINNKILLSGASGCGKTSSAKAIAFALKKPIYILNLSNIISSRIGETAQFMKIVFDKAAREKGVLFIDEFDLIGKERGTDEKDVGEMRRLVNSLIQLIDYFPEHALLLGATNHPEIVDHALLRRFQLKMTFELPSDMQLNQYYDSLLTPLPEYIRGIDRKYGISFAEAKDTAYTQAKAFLIQKLDNMEML